MKHIFLTILILVTINCKAQSPIVDIDTWDGESQENAYYKDVNNFFDDFEGTWVYTNGTTSLKIILEKKVMKYTGKFYKDGMKGEYQYIENGAEKINTLTNLSQPNRHSLRGDNLLLSHHPPYCSDCSLNERRLKLSIIDYERDITGTLVLKKITVNGQPALEGFIWCDGVGTYNENNPPEHFTFTLPKGTFVFIKQ